MLWGIDDLSSGVMLWYLELASIRERYFTLFNFGKISLSISPLWTGHISTWFSLARSRHSMTFPLDLGTSTKLLPHSAVSSTPSGDMLPCYVSHSNSSLKGVCSAKVTCLRGAWYGLLSVFTCNENVPSKYCIPLKTFSKSLCSHFVISVLAPLSLSSLGLERNIQFHCYCPLAYLCYSYLNLNYCLCLYSIFPTNLILTLYLYNTAQFLHPGWRLCLHCNWHFYLFPLYLLHCG